LQKEKLLCHPDADVTAIIHFYDFMWTYFISLWGKKTLIFNHNLTVMFDVLKIKRHSTGFPGVVFMTGNGRNGGRVCQGSYDVFSLGMELHIAH
jgi:hypothetical protein